MKVSELDAMDRPIRDDDVMYIVDDYTGSRKITGAMLNQSVKNFFHITEDENDPEHIIIS